VAADGEDRLLKFFQLDDEFAQDPGRSLALEPGEVALVEDDHQQGEVAGDRDRHRQCQPDIPEVAQGGEKGGHRHQDEGGQAGEALDKDRSVGLGALPRRFAQGPGAHHIPPDVGRQHRIEKIAHHVEPEKTPARDGDPLSAQDDLPLPGAEPDQNGGEGDGEAEIKPVHTADRLPQFVKIDLVQDPGDQGNADQPAQQNGE